MSDADRTVHATLPDGGQLVRYDRASRWHLEFPDGSTTPTHKRRLLTLDEAVALALDAPSVDMGPSRSGAVQFASRLRRAKLRREKETCDHAARCCLTHDTHTMPHRGCILR